MAETSAERIERLKYAGWIGVDLDGTLAHYDGYRGNEHIGEPIPAMLERVQAWRKAGVEVRIFTARVARESHHARGEWLAAIDAVRQWSIRHIGVELLTTAQKDRDMIELWDDRAVQVIRNTGKRADGEP